MNQTSFATPEQPASLIALYGAMWRYARGARVKLLGSAAMLMSSQVVKLAVPFMAAQAINTTQVSGLADIGQAIIWIVGILVIYAVSWSLHGPGRVLERSVGVQVREAVSDALFAKLINAPLAWHEKHHSGEVQHRIAQASRALYDFAQNQFIYLQMAVNIVGPLLALTLLSQWAGGAAITGYLLIGTVIIGFDIALMRLAARENAAERRYAAGVLDLLSNVSTVLSLRLQSAARKLVSGRLRAVFEPLRRMIVLNEAKWCAVDLLTLTLSWGLVIVYAWQTRSTGEALLVGSLFMVYQYAQQAGSVIGSMALHFQAFSRYKTDYASAGPIWQAVQRAESSAALADCPSDWRRICLRNIEYEYARADGKAAGVYGVHLTVERGERVALVGPSGSGKSTLLRLIAGLYDAQKGHYEIDGVHQLAMRHLGSVSTLIPQEAEVFEASVLDNITFAIPHDESALQNALHVSAFDTVVSALPKGLQTLISERGFNLSGGQRQRLALARGVLAAEDHRSSIVLLDEPTSALDSVTESKVHRRLDEAFSGATIVASVHRMSLLAHFDRIVLMVGGRIVDTGSVADLLKRQPQFEEMYIGSADIKGTYVKEAANVA